MKKFLILAVLLGLMTLTVSAFAANATANATATIQTGIGITNTPEIGDLKFGTMVPGAAASTVRVDATLSAERLVVTGDAVLVTDIGNAAQSARFDVSGAPSTAYTITLPGDCTLHNTRTNHTSEQMTVNGWLCSIPTTLSAGHLNESGAQAFYVGGILNIGAAQPDGLYSGPFTVTVAY